MAKASEQFRQSDVTLWGVTALVSLGLAVFGANVSALMPQSLLGALHQPRVTSSSLDSIRLQVSGLTEETLRLKRENEQLSSRFGLQERTSNEVVRRVGALEVSVPKLLEAIPAGALVDRANLTASVGGDETLTFDAEGGSVAVRQFPMPGLATPAAAQQPLPALVESTTASASGYGVAIGAPIDGETAPALWRDLNVKLGPLLFGMTPLVSDDTEPGQQRIIIGPIADIVAARALCERVERVSVACLPTPYAGLPLDSAVSASEGG
ncbi:MAG: hypothetical protein KIT02_02460 [Devosia sp.]|uniref:hypothetical protein n=1 Tax=Devosia sp. TaxID=1871048 RepID=UPI0024C613A7|nr:hypothetical protein [Devosia sp.]UYO00115.1 MAG: hypothetical protein KIT02_02460 [Devosia sp.]